MQYLDFDLEIGPGDGSTYPVAVIRSPAGEAHATLRFPFDEAALKEYLNLVQTALASSGQQRRQAAAAVQHFGQQVFEALFTGDVRSCYDVSQREAARQSERGLRVKLRIQAPELAVLPWEFLYDPRQGEYLCLSRQTPLVRYLELPQVVQPLKVKPPLRILGMVASPGDQDPLDISREQRRIQEALAGLQEQGLVELIWLAGQTWHDLQRAMRNGPWHIFHFTGHGGFDPSTEEGVLALTNEQGTTSLLTATQLGHLLTDHRSLRLVLLNACEGAHGNKRDLFSSTAATLARRGIPAVIAMQYEITDSAAIECTRAFYEALADGLPVDAAVAEARKAISLSLASTLEWAIPVLYLRSPDSTLFEIAKPQEKHRRPATAGRTGKAPAARTSTAASQRGTLITTYRGHDDWVTSLAWSPDGTRITSAQKFDRFVHVWDTEVGAQLLIYEGHSQWVRAAPWSPDGKRIASCGEDGVVQVWEAETGKLVCSYSGHQGRVFDTAWSPDGKRIASCGEDGTIHIWGAASGGRIATYHHGDTVGTLAWSPDSKRIVSGSSDGTARIWDMDNREPLFIFDRHESTVYTVAWSPDGKRIASCGEDGTIHIWSPGTNGNVLSTNTSEHLILSLAWSPDSKRLVSACDEQALLWDASTLETIYSYSGHTHMVRVVAWSPDGSRIASASNDGTAQVWLAG